MCKKDEAQTEGSSQAGRTGFPSLRGLKPGLSLTFGTGQNRKTS